MLKRFAFIAALVGITCCGSTTSDGPDSPDTPTTPTNPTTPTAVVGDVSINVMTFNIRYDNTGDGQNIWANRRDRAANAIKFYSPDLFGTQETLHNQLEDLKSRLPEYAVRMARKKASTAPYGTKKTVSLFSLRATSGSARLPTLPVLKAGTVPASASPHGLSSKTSTPTTLCSSSTLTSTIRVL